MAKNTAPKPDDVPDLSTIGTNSPEPKLEAKVGGVKVTSLGWREPSAQELETHYYVTPQGSMRTSPPSSPTPSTRMAPRPEPKKK